MRESVVSRGFLATATDERSYGAYGSLIGALTTGIVLTAAAQHRAPPSFGDGRGDEAAP